MESQEAQKISSALLELRHVSRAPLSQDLARRARLEEYVAASYPGLRGDDRGMLDNWIERHRERDRLGEILARHPNLTPADLDTAAVLPVVREAERDQSVRP